MQQEQNKVALFKPAEVRNEVVTAMEAMQKSKFVNLPENYKEAAFFVVEKLANLEDIEKVPTMNITKTMIEIFSNKLDFRKSHCYFFVQNDKTSPTGKSLRFGWQYQGLIHVAKLDCNVEDVTPVLVFDGDQFETHYEDGALIVDKHVPTFEGNIRGGYCVVTFTNNVKQIRYYTLAELDMRRDKSKAKQGSFWAWQREMYEKTLINSTVKRIIETSPDTEGTSLYDEPEHKELRSTDDDFIPQDDVYDFNLIEDKENKEPQQEKFELK
jgi:recombinational DNA repair protein RecT